ncbi:MAG: KamA family radical SAM protein [Alphaproteobacteria bacterium]|nr:KamA family radical SAM protein [Alphaproteobacteria bacterium]
MYHEGRPFDDAPTSRRGPMAGRGELLARFPGLDRAVWARADARFPVRITRSWLARLRGPSDPLARQALPDAQELVDDAGDRADPVGEHQRQPLPWVVRKHPDRVLLLLTRRCHLYCRYCFRRGDHGGPEDPTPAELAAALDYIRGSGARELILSGGDPLAVRDERLFAVIDAVRPELPVVRVHSRAPITAPHRITDALVSGLAARGPVWVLVHCNHPDELSTDVRAALGRLVDAGLPVLNQAVLLRGVNDDAAVLARLSDELVALRVRPYYLHHTDHAPGNAAFRVDPHDGLRIHDELRLLVSGIGLPRYVIDPPDGGGKLDVQAWVRAGQRRPVPSLPPPPPARKS